jgi:hypothetical protein
MGPSGGVDRRRRAAWALPEPPGVVLWQLGMAWSSLAAVVDASMGRRVVLSGLVLLGPVCVFFTGRWLRTALAGAWATGLVVVLGIPDGIAGTRLEAFLITVAVFVAVLSTLALVITIRTCLSLTVTAVLAACGGHAPSSGSRPASSPVSCRQQYQTWKHGPAQKSMGSLAAALKTIRADRESGNAAGVRSGMRDLVPDALGLAHHPMPHCADPASLYQTFVTNIYTAGSRARSAKGAGAVLRVAASLNGVQKLGRQLTTEISHVLAKD